MSTAELLSVIAVDVNCHLHRKDTGKPQYALFVLNMQCLGFLYTYNRKTSLIRPRSTLMY